MPTTVPPSASSVKRTGPKHPHVLVVFYSRTGTTRKVASAISAALACDVEELIDTRRRTGLIGYLRCGLDATFHRLTTLKPMMRDPAQYDLVIVGTPVWNHSMSSAIRTYLTLHKGRFKAVAFFCSEGGAGSRQVFRQMAEIGGRRPVDELEILEADVTHDEYAPKIHEFTVGLGRAIAA